MSFDSFTITAIVVSVVIAITLFHLASKQMAN